MQEKEGCRQRPGKDRERRMDDECADAMDGVRKLEEGPMKKPKRKGKTAKKPRSRSRRRVAGDAREEAFTPSLDTPRSYTSTGPALSGGDVDADWQDAETSGEETVGGTVATPDQDVVDEIGRALGVEQSPTAPAMPTEDLLHDRDRRRWELERRADRKADRKEGRG